MASDARRLAEQLGLAPHPEGGWYRETWRHRPEDGSRGAGTAIYYLLEGGAWSAWHRIDAAEVWHHYAGAPLELQVAAEGGSPVSVVLGKDLTGGAEPQRLVPPSHWQRARSLGDWTLVGCTVSPAFLFERFELSTAADGPAPSPAPAAPPGEAPEAPAQTTRNTST